MTLPPDTRKRLEFLTRVVAKEVKHLDYASQQAFKTPLTQQKVDNLEQDPELALKIEAFTSRFCRLQDTLGDKLLPALLKALGEPAQALLINLNKAEKYGWLDSAETWMQLRQLRNQMIHEYIEDTSTLLAALTTAAEKQKELNRFADNLTTQTKSLLEE
ncbi:hypothetical protein SAMN05660443_2402 [Marinospirillum celere]|uniref:Nucleotidyltransferase substrate binding protein, HI0074 family n=1 Tax=Marinospirillum celere TaxID=1122252 RepID=A0A1I1INW3_9GAMM|nr:hypothetical protein [Marinospirillum celere]SFC37402.1 hypothetical protein SAMN05660443_2402 [Marinospirillum celere]